jgi:hypothetical protein
MTAQRIARRALGLIVGGLAILSLATPDADAVVGRPLTPVSVAGVSRRTTRRQNRREAYAGGAYSAGPAPVAAPPPGCAPGVPCGGVTYQPAYSGPDVVYVPR